jgi:hypothetical protein
MPVAAFLGGVALVMEYTDAYRIRDGREEATG